MDEHTALRERAGEIRQALAHDDRAAAWTLLAGFVADLDRHVRREEAGIFTALREDGEFAEEVDALEAEHDDFDVAIGALAVESSEFAGDTLRLLDELDQHIEREDLGIFPVAVVTLGAAGWETVTRAHEMPLDSPEGRHRDPARLRRSS